MHPEALRGIDPPRTRGPTSASAIGATDNVVMHSMADLGDIADEGAGQHRVIGQQDMLGDGMEPCGSSIDAMMFLFESPIDIDPIVETQKQASGLRVQAMLSERDRE